MQVSDKLQPQLASQGIAINRATSSDNSVRLSVNSYQPLTGPVAWYEAKLKSNEGLDIVGGTFPSADLGWSSTIFDYWVSV